MKALTLTAPSQFAFGEVPAPAEPADDEVRVRVRACGICGSDIHGMDGRSGRRLPPLIMGHEAAGDIEAVGKDVAGWQVGERVTFDSTVFCGECEQCEAGNTNLCQNRQVMGVACAAFRRNGCFAEYATMPARILHRVPEKLAYEEAAFAEPVGVALHAVAQANIQPGQSAVVVGSGLIGLLIIQALRVAGAGVIVAVDKEESRLKLAIELGASHSIAADGGQEVEQIRALIGGDGADAAFEVVGAGGPMMTAIKSVRCGGTVCCVGNLQPEVPIPLQLVVTRELRLVGTCAIRDEYPRAIALIASGKIKVRPLLSALAPLEEGADWFARLRAGGEGLFKVVLCP